MKYFLFVTIVLLIYVFIFKTKMQTKIFSKDQTATILST